MKQFLNSLENKIADARLALDEMEKHVGVLKSWLEVEPNNRSSLSMTCSWNVIQSIGSRLGLLDNLERSNRLQTMVKNFLSSNHTTLADILKRNKAA